MAQMLGQLLYSFFKCEAVFGSLATTLHDITPCLRVLIRMVQHFENPIMQSQASQFPSQQKTNWDALPNEAAFVCSLAICSFDFNQRGQTNHEQSALSASTQFRLAVIEVIRPPGVHAQPSLFANHRGKHRIFPESTFICTVGSIGSVYCHRAFFTTDEFKRANLSAGGC